MKRDKLSGQELSEALKALPGWQLAADGLSIARSYRLPSFMAAIDFVGRVAAIAEAADHHPDIDVRYKTVSLVYSTHSAGGLTALDLEGAAACDASSGAA